MLRSDDAAAARMQRGVRIILQHLAAIHPHRIEAARLPRVAPSPARHIVDVLLLLVVQLGHGDQIHVRRHPDPQDPTIRNAPALR